MLVFSTASIVGMTINFGLMILALLMNRSYNRFGWSLFNLVAIKYLYLNSYGFYLFFFTDSNPQPPLDWMNPMVLMVIQFLIWLIVFIYAILMNLPKIRDKFKVGLWLQLTIILIIAALMKFITFW